MSILLDTTLLMIMRSRHCVHRGAEHGQVRSKLAPRGGTDRYPSEGRPSGPTLQLHDIVPFKVRKAGRVSELGGQRGGEERRIVTVDGYIDFACHSSRKGWSSSDSKSPSETFEEGQTSAGIASCTSRSPIEVVEVSLSFLGSHP
jgi:hypothetical protein